MDYGRLFRTLGHSEAVFVERPAMLQRTAPQADIVLLAASEIDKGKGEFLRLHHTQVALRAILETYTRFRRTMHDHFIDEGMMNEKVRNLLRVG